MLNRSNGRLRMFRKEDDFAAFERILAEGIDRFKIRLTGYCLMSNHWHLLLWTRGDDEEHKRDGCATQTITDKHERIWTLWTKCQIKSWLF